MMNVQSISCQPIKPLQSNPSFASRRDDFAPWNIDDEGMNADMLAIEKERDEWAQIAKNKDNKMLSALGTLGVSAMAGALSFCTFKTVAPKGYQTLKSIVGKITGNKLVRKAAGSTLAAAKFLGAKVKGLYGKINPESKLGKVKGFVETKLATIKNKLSPIFQKGVNATKGFAEKHNIDKAWFKTAMKNTGATAVAIPAAVTAGNATDNVKGEV